MARPQYRIIKRILNSYEQCRREADVKNSDPNQEYYFIEKIKWFRYTEINVKYHGKAYYITAQDAYNALDNFLRQDSRSVVAEFNSVLLR